MNRHLTLPAPACVPAPPLATAPCEPSPPDSGKGYTPRQPLSVTRLIIGQSRQGLQPGAARRSHRDHGMYTEVTGRRDDNEWWFGKPIAWIETRRHGEKPTVVLKQDAQDEQNE